MEPNLSQLATLTDGELLARLTTAGVVGPDSEAALSFLRGSSALGVSVTLVAVQCCQPPEFLQVNALHVDRRQDFGAARRISSIEVQFAALTSRYQRSSEIAVSGCLWA